MKPITFSGRVLHGKHLGRTIGFPTANITLPKESSHVPPGTYGLMGEIGGESYFGIGVYLAEKELFEAHLFDFGREIYEEVLTLTLLVHLRENQKFSSLDALKEQIEKDKALMEDWIAREKSEQN